MATGVYANDREICAKASDGASTAAFPDPCWTPPAPPVVVPYPNTAKAVTLEKGSTTVFIKNTMIAKEDKSYFASSTGNEGATQGQPKGVATGAITGKAYFQSWSPNVKVEGRCVARHQDLMTHNHGSFPSNTPVFPYISRSIWRGHACKKEEEKIERACKPEKDDSNARKEIHSKSKLRHLLKSKRKKKNKDRKHWHWTDDHCDGLEVPISSAENLEEYIEQMKEVVEQLPNELNLLNQLEGYLKEMVTDAALWVAGKWSAKAGAKQVVGSVVPGYGNAVMAVVSAVDAAVAVGDIFEVKAVATEALEQLQVLKDKLAEIEKLGERITKLDEKAIADLAADSQDMLATLNACTRARKCSLVPYKTKNTVTGVRKRLKVETATGKGCCPGQTGHHLLNNKMVEDSCPGWTDVQANLAPTVCVEGTSWHKGSHARVHRAMAYALEDITKAKDDTMTLTQAINAAVTSHREAFPYAGCSPQCIRQQLESFYSICKGGRAKAVDEYGKEVDNNGNDNDE